MGEIGHKFPNFENLNAYNFLQKYRRQPPTLTNTIIGIGTDCLLSNLASEMEIIIFRYYFSKRSLSF